MKAEQITEVVEKLIGPIRPVGESNVDADRLENMEEFIKVFAWMHVQIDEVAYDFKDSRAASEKRIADVANAHLNSMGIEQ